jgi:hypothetical protein
MRRRWQPRVEALESLITLSMMPVGPGTMASAHVSHRGRAVALHGQLTGTLTANMTIPDTGGSLSFNGSGSLRRLGPTLASGTFHTPGFIRVGVSTAPLVLTTSRGSISLTLTSGPQPGFSGPDGSYTYTIDGGTGAFARATGHGQALFTESGGQGTLTFS